MTSVRQISACVYKLFTIHPKEKFANKMKGKILDFSIQSNSGAISGEDGERYNFDGPDWKGDSPPTRGMSVDFSVENNQAKEVYLAVSSATASGKSKIAAGLLVIFLGGLGIHKFYLGYTVPGVVLLLMTCFGWLLLFIPNIAISIIVIIEGIIYLTKSDEEFEQTYVTGSKPMF